MVAVVVVAVVVVAVVVVVVVVVVVHRAELMMGQVGRQAPVS